MTLILKVLINDWLGLFIYSWAQVLVCVSVGSPPSSDFGYAMDLSTIATMEEAHWGEGCMIIRIYLTLKLPLFSK